MTVDDLDNVAEIVDDGDSVPDDDCDRERVLQGDAVTEPEAVPHALTDGDEDAVVELDTLPDPLMVTVFDGLMEVDEVREVEKVDEPVVEEVTVIVPDCETELVPQDEALLEPVTVPHVLVVVDGDGVVDIDVVTDTVLELIADDVSKVENVADTVEDIVNEPDAD